MISNQILQNTIEGLKGITRIDFCVIDTDGKTLASTFAEHMSFAEEIALFVGSQADSQIVKACAAQQGVNRFQFLEGLWSSGIFCLWRGRRFLLY